MAGSPEEHAGRGAPLTVGTAGHVDHGKTTLVAALTGVETDRLPEERERGLSIALGYAPLVLPSGRRLSLVDVPGHERFVRTMVAGATGVDCALLVIAADDGVMPQTLEHLEVLRGLGVTGLVVAVTKLDRADPGDAVAQARELVGDGPEIVPVSGRTGEGVAALRAALERLADATPSRAASGPPDGEPPLLHVDRAFVVDGRGTVVTGTLVAGALAIGDALGLLPGDRPVRVRGLEVHDAPLPRAVAGQRVAVNLAGVRARDVGRGDVLAHPGTRRERLVLDCVLALAQDARHGERVHVHHGTRETPARLGHLEGDLWQLRLQRPLVAEDGDRLVVRRLAPPATLGGGRVLDASARRHGRREDLLEPLRARRDGRPAGPAPAPDEADGDRDGSGPAGAPPATVSAEEAAAPPAVVADLSAEATALLERLVEAGAALVPETLVAEPAALRELVAAGRAVRVSGRLYGDRAAVQVACERILEIVDDAGSASLAEVRDALGLSRKPAQALLEHLDAARVLRRRPDDRRVRTRAAR